jgi:hypothetical protein
MRFGLVRHWPWWKDGLGLIVLAGIVVADRAARRLRDAPAPDPRDEAFQQHLGSLAAQMDAGSMTRKEAAVSARDRARALFGDPYMDELWSYRVVLAEQVEKGQTTVDQAAYLDQQKVNEIMERLKVAPPAQRRLFQPAVTCRPDGYGGVRCR